MSDERLTQDEKDTIVVAHTVANMNRCIGGRIVCEGYICPHCGSANPTEQCRGDRVTDSPLIVEVES